MPGAKQLPFHRHRQKPCRLGKIITPFLPRHVTTQGHSLTDIARDSHFYFTPLLHRIVTDSAAIFFNFRRMGIVIIIQI